MGAVLQHHTLKVPNTCPNWGKKIRASVQQFVNKANFLIFKIKKSCFVILLQSQLANFISQYGYTY
jgi:hypothetical protein